MSQQEGPSTLTLPHNSKRAQQEYVPRLGTVFVCLAFLSNAAVETFVTSATISSCQLREQLSEVKHHSTLWIIPATASDEVPPSGLRSCIQCSHLRAKGQSPENHTLQECIILLT